MSLEHRIVALLVLGGAGTRLWPLSTDQKPKQFLKLFGNRSLFQMTLARVMAAGVKDIVIVSNVLHERVIEEDLGEVGLEKPLLLFEPLRRDSAPAIAAGAAFIRDRYGPEAVIAALPGDHLIRNEPLFASALHAAAEIAAAGALVTFGIRATFPATEYGYLERGLPHPHGMELKAFSVARFHEKPDRSKAEAYLRRGDYDWNSGMFVFSGELFAAEASQHMPNIWNTVCGALRAGVSHRAGLLMDADAFASAQKISIDYALMEKSRRLAMIPVDLDWSDIGNWASIYQALPKDDRGNAVLGEVAIQDCSDSLMVAQGRPLAAAGLKDMVVVGTEHGTFAAPMTRSAEIKELVGAWSQYSPQHSNV